MVSRLTRMAAMSSAAVLSVGIAWAGPASAAVTVTPPDQVRVKPGTVVIVQINTPEGYVCETDWSTPVEGKKRVVKSVSPVSCSGGKATWRVKISQVKRGEAYVYFTVTSVPMEMTGEDGSTYAVDPITEVFDLTITLKGSQPRPASGNANGCVPDSTKLCTAIGYA